MKRIALTFISMISINLAAQTLNQIAVQNGVTLTPLEESIILTSNEIETQNEQLQEYSGTYENGILSCQLSNSDYIKYENNLIILKHIYEDLMPSLINDAKNYFISSLDFTEEEITELNTLYFSSANQIPFISPIYFNGEEAPENCNLTQVNSNVPLYNGLSPVYQPTWENIYPTKLPRLTNEFLPILALAMIEVRVKTPQILNYQDGFSNFVDYYDNSLIESPSTEIDGVNSEIGNLVFNSNTYSEENYLTWGDVGACALAATGLNLISQIKKATLSAGGKLTMTLFKSAFKTAIKRLAGPIGVAWMVGEFGICLGVAHYNN